MLQRVRFAFLVAFVTVLLVSSPATAKTRFAGRPTPQVAAATFWSWIAQRMGNFVPAFAKSQGTVEPGGEAPVSTPSTPVPTGTTLDVLPTLDPNG